jgi:hypothetical protein
MRTRVLLGWLVLAAWGCSSEDDAARGTNAVESEADDDGSTVGATSDDDGAEGPSVATDDDSALDDDVEPSDGRPSELDEDEHSRPVPLEPDPGDDDVASEPTPPGEPDPVAVEEPVPTMAEPEEPAVPEPSPEPSDLPSPQPDVSAPEPEVGPTPGIVEGPNSGNPEGACETPADAGLEDTSNPTVVVGNGTMETCTQDAVIDAVARGGIITFACGPEPVTITLDRPAKVFNDTGPKIVIDGGGLVTLSGGGTSRILYMNTCDENQVWTTAECQNQDHPQLTVQNLTFVDGNSTAETEYDGGGAVWVRGGRFKVVNSRFFNNVCASEGPDVGGGAIRVLSQYDGLPVYVVESTFGGAEGLGNVGSNGGALSSIGVSWSIFNSVFSYNRAVGNGGNPAQDGTPGGGSGGAIYNDGNTMTLSLCGSRIEYNEVNAYGSAIFFVSNDHSGNVAITDSVISNNIGGSWYPTYPQISNHDDTPITVVDSIIE